MFVLQSIAHEHVSAGCNTHEATKLVPLLRVLGCVPVYFYEGCDAGELQCGNESQAALVNAWHRTNHRLPAAARHS